MTTTTTPATAFAGATSLSTGMLFSEIAERDEDLFFRKHNGLLGVPVLRGELTFIARKAFNGLIYNAQRAGRPGVNAPIADHRFTKSYWVRLSDLARDIGFGSKNTEVLRKAIVSLKGVSFELHEGFVQGGFEHLLSGAWFIKPGRNGIEEAGRTVPVYVAYQFGGVFESMIQDPAQYTRMRLMYQRHFSSDQTLAFYEALRRFAGSPRDLSCRLPWQEWFHVVSGKPKSASVPEFRSFKRHVLLPAISEINQVSDIRVRILAYKERKAIKDLQFEVKLKIDAEPATQTGPQGELNQDDDVVANLRERMTKLGVTQRAIKTTFKTKTYAQIEAALQLVEGAVRSDARSVNNPGGYFTRAVSEGWKAQGSTLGSTPKPSQQFVTVSTTKVQSEATDHQRQMLERGRALFQAMVREQQESEFEAYLSEVQSPRLRAMYVKAGPLAPQCGSFLIALAARSTTRDVAARGAAEAIGGVQGSLSL